MYPYDPQQNDLVELHKLKHKMATICMKKKKVKN